MAITAAWSNFSSASALTSHTPTLPSGRTGKRVFAFVFTAGGGTLGTETPPSNWNLEAKVGATASGYHIVYWRDCDGTSADNLVITLSVAKFIRVAFAVLTGAGPDAADHVTNAVVSGTSIPTPSITPSWAPRETIYFVSCQSSNTGTGTLPSGYSTGQNLVGTASLPGVCVGYKVLAVGAAESPGNFTFSVSQTSVGAAIHANAGKLVVTPPLHTNAPGIPADVGMQTADPLAVGVAISTDAAAGTTHTLNLPAAVPGQRRMVWMISLGATQAAAGSFPAGWTQGIQGGTSSSPAIICAYRDVQVGDPNSITITSTNSVRATFATCVLPVNAIFLRTPNFQFVGGNISTAQSSIPSSPGLAYPGAWDNTKQGECYGFSVHGFLPNASPPALSTSPTGHEEVNYVAPTAATYGIAIALLRTATYPNRQAIWTFAANWAANNASQSIANVRATQPVATISMGTLATILSPSRFDNVSVFYAPTVKARIAAPLHTNAQAFFAAKLSLRYKQAARFDNAQTFFDAAVHATSGIFAPKHINAQTFFSPSLRLTYKSTARFDNAQTFFAPRVTFAAFVAPNSPHINAQTFFAPTITQRLTLTLTTRHQNLQSFFTPAVKLGFTKVVGARFDNVQVFYGPTVARAVYAISVTARFDNAQSFFAPTVVKATPGLKLPPFFVNSQIFFGPTVYPRPARPDKTPGAIGAGWWRQPGDPKKKKEPEPVLDWLVPTALEVKNEAPPWNPVVVTPAMARQNAIRLKRHQDRNAANAKRRSGAASIDGIILRAFEASLKGK